MFDWDDEELTNMIWGDDAETGDHIVPFKLRSERGEESKTVKHADQNGKAGGSSGHNVDDGNPHPEFCMSSWPESSVSNAREADPDSNATQLPKCSDEPPSYATTKEKTSELGKGPHVFHSTDESQEQRDFDEYGWANIGSFDDLDRMFSNDVPIFGDGCLSGADELWSSSKDVSSSPKSLLSILDSQDLGLDIVTASEEQENQQFPLTGEANGVSSQSVASLPVTPKGEQYREHQPSVEDQPYKQNKMMKFSKTSGTTVAGAFQDVYSQRTLSRNLPGNFLNQLAPSRSSLMAVNLQCGSQRSDTSHYPHMPNQYMATSGFGNLINPYSPVPVLSAVQCPDVKSQFMHPSYNPATATDSSARPSTMTPQEKLEKLRRRQQMQAMLAIQRQQQQFRHPVPIADQSVTQNCRQDKPPQVVDKTNLQGLTTMPSFDPNSSLEVDDSENLAADVDNSTEFSVLYRLQDVVGKLDMGIRTCIRDSLYRLAGSAGRRHHTSDTAHSKQTSQDDQEESRYRYAGMPDTETVTNPTDRTVAHLLFHRPFDMPAARHMEGPASPASSKIGAEGKGNLSKCKTRESRIHKQNAQVEGPAGSLALGNAPNSGSSSSVGERDAEASQGNKRKL